MSRRDERAERELDLEEHDLDDGQEWHGPDVLRPTRSEAERDQRGGSR